MICDKRGASRKKLGENLKRMGGKRIMEQTRITKNGIVIYSYPNEHLHSFCVALYVKAGCLYEAENENGITHLLEHLAFRNIDRLMDGELYHVLDRCGLSFNASTYKEFVQFIITGALEHYDQAIEIITKVFEPLVLTKEKIDLEKQRVKAEIWEKAYEKSLDCFTDQIIWKGTGLTRDIAGKIGPLSRLGKNQLEQAHKRMFSRNNVFFYLTGNVKETQIDQLEEKLLAYPMEETVPLRTNEAPVPENFSRRDGMVDIKNNDYCFVRFSFDIDVKKYKNAELDLLYDILFSGDSCVVYQELSEKSGLIYSFDARFEQYKNIGNIYFSYEVRHNALMESIKIILQKLHDLKNSMEGALFYVIAPYVDNAYIMYDDVDDFNWTFAYENHIIDCGYQSIEDRKNAYSQVTEERLKELVRDILRKDNLVVTLKGQKKKIDLDEVKKLIDLL